MTESLNNIKLNYKGLEYNTQVKLFKELDDYIINMLKDDYLIWHKNLDDNIKLAINHLINYITLHKNEKDIQFIKDIEYKYITYYQVMQKIDKLSIILSRPAKDIQCFICEDQGLYCEEIEIHYDMKQFKDSVKKYIDKRIKCPICGSMSTIYIDNKIRCKECENLKLENVLK